LSVYFFRQLTVYSHFLDGLGLFGTNSIQTFTL
jgi:hypothetical protein